MNTVQLDMLLGNLGLLAVIVIMIWNNRTDARMHQAHARMINLLMDYVIAEKKADVVKLLQGYNTLIKTPKDVVH